MAKLIDLVKEVLGRLSSYKKKYEEEKRRREELECEIAEAIKMIEDALKEQ